MANAIRTEYELGIALDALWSDISNDCAQCTDPDCKGYVWLTKGDKVRFIDNGIPFIRANGIHGPCFIDSYRRTATGVLDPAVRSPDCPHRLSTGLCTIHANRPLPCRMYPLSLEVLGTGEAFWVLHTNCAHVRRLTGGGGLQPLIEKIGQLLDSLAPKLTQDVLGSFAKVSELSEPTLDESDIIRIRPTSVSNKRVEYLQ